jgi:uncharacterized protein (DUF2384 family)
LKTNDIVIMQKATNKLETSQFISIEIAPLGKKIFGSMETFNLWLHTPSFALGSIKPIELLKDSYGKDLVINELHRIDYGIFA